MHRQIVTIKHWFSRTNVFILFVFFTTLQSLYSPILFSFTNHLFNVFQSIIIISLSVLEDKLYKVICLLANRSMTYSYIHWFSVKTSDIPRTMWYEISSNLDREMKIIFFINVDKIKFSFGNAWMFTNYN